MLKLTLAFPIRDNEVLLGMKKRGFGESKWNGFGGHVEDGESIIQAAQRELFEESKLEGGNWHEHAIVYFHFANAPTRKVHIYSVTDFLNDPFETEEMKPQWFHFDTIPYDQMWEDDIHWLPYLLDGKTFEGKVSFDENFKMIEHSFSLK